MERDRVDKRIRAGVRGSGYMLTTILSVAVLASDPFS